MAKPKVSARSVAKSLRFTRIQIENWRNFKRVDVALEQRAFLVGPNAAGKSNLLEALRFLHDIVADGGGLQFAVSKGGGVSKIRALTARRKSDISINAWIGNDEAPELWSYHLRFNQDPQLRAVVKAERVLQKGRVLLDRPDKGDNLDPQRKSQTMMEQVTANKEFREVADFLRTVRYLHIVPQLVRDPDRSVGKHNDPFGGDFLERIGATKTPTRRAWLRRIQGALTVAVPQLTELEFKRDEQGRAHLRGKYEHWRPQGAWQEEQQFSDGTLRLIGLLWALLDGSGPILLEEPELSLHPEVIRYLPQMFARIQRRGGRQVLVSTHSRDLLSDRGIGLDEVLLLIPSDEGTVVRAASTFDDIRWLLEGGLNLADAVIPKTRPGNAEQLTLFAE